MTNKTATKKDAAQTSDEAGATPPFDARCVTVLRGVAPASWRKGIAPMVWPRRELRVRKSTARGGRHGNRQKTTGKCQPLAAARAAGKRAARRLRAVRRLHARLRREFRTAQDARARP